MADIDPSALLLLADDLKTKSKTFSDAGKKILDQATALDSHARDLAENTTTWAGKGSQAFLNTWTHFHSDTINSVIALNATSQVLEKLAKKLDDYAQKIMDLQTQAALSMLATAGLLAVDIAQLGLDPLTDGATVGTGAAATSAEEQIAEEESALATFDTEISAEIDSITNSIQNSSELDSLTLDETASSELSQIEDELLDEELQGQGFVDSDAIFAKRNSPLFRNPINMDVTSTTKNMPKGVNNEIAKHWIEQIEGKGVRVEWNRSIQVQLEDDEAFGATYNNNGWDKEYANANLAVVGLSPDATNATVYEEYLHVEALEARGWVRLPKGDESVLAEEIQVEYQVLQNAENLDMSGEEFDSLTAIRRSYINRLRNLYEKNGTTWPPSNLAPYLQDPPKPQ